MRRLPVIYPFAVALQFMTRLPLPHNLNPRVEDMQRAAVYFPLVGVIVGTLAWLPYWGLLQLGATELVAAGVYVATLPLITGAFHEDGLADSADGVYGGMNRERRLEIMRDSRLGTYGTISLVILFLLRFSSIQSIPLESSWSALVTAHVLGRWSSLPLIATMPYARAERDGTPAKPLIEGVGFKQVAVATGLLIAILVGLGQEVASTGRVLAATLVITAGTGLVFRRKIGGITGDTLGATNVLCECAIIVIIGLNSQLAG